MLFVLFLVLEYPRYSVINSKKGTAIQKFPYLMVSELLGILNPNGL